MPRLRSTVRSVAVPFLRPMWRKVWALIEGRIAPVDARLTALEPFADRVVALETAWRQNIPAFLNAVGTVPALAYELSALRALVQQAAVRLDNGDASTAGIWKDIASLQARIGEAAKRLDDGDASARVILEDINSLQARTTQAATRLDNQDANNRAIWERIEFVRREILFEMAHGERTRTHATGARTTVARILSEEKVSAALADDSLRLNLGCGHMALPDYVNVDRRALPSVDVIAEVDDLPIEQGSVQELFSSHLLEHFPQEAMRRRLLPYWRDMLRPGGTFRAITPDGAAMLAGAGAGTYGYDDFREVLFGSQDYVGDYHYNLFTPDSLRGLLEEAGFTDIEIPAAARRNGKCFEFEISARRP